MRNLFLLDPDVVYLNHGSFGACPAPVFETYQALQRELERQPVEFLALERGLPQRLDAARLRLAAFVGANPDNLALTQNASFAINAVVRSLDLRPGDELLLGDAEYGGMQILLEHVASAHGVRLRRAPFSALDPGPRTRAVFCSHIEWSSGRVNDVAGLCSQMRDAGVLTIVDGAHAPGQLTLDLEAIGADVYAGNCHKWLCSPKGAGFLYARPQVQELIEPIVLSWDWLDGAPFHARHRWQGTRDPAALLAIPAAIEFQETHDWEEVRRRCHTLLAAASLGLAPLTDDFVQMRGFRLSHPDPNGLKRRLYEQHQIEVPVFEAGGGWVLRVSVQAYNTDDDLELLRRALADELRTP